MNNNFNNRKNSDNIATQQISHINSIKNANHNNNNLISKINIPNNYNNANKQNNYNSNQNQSNNIKNNLHPNNINNQQFRNNHKIEEDVGNNYMLIPKDENLADIVMDDNLLNNDEFISGIYKIQSILIFHFDNIISIKDQKVQDPDDWEYLKKTISKEGKYLSDDFIRYHQITEQIIEDEDLIINNHMNIIKVNKIILMF